MTADVIRLPKNRPAFEAIFMRLAFDLSDRSTCRRLAVGAVVTSDDFRQVYSIGYNGNTSKGANDCDRHGAEAVGNCGCLHAEENAAINCTAPRSAHKIVFCTHLPCVMCAKRLVNLGGVAKLFYAHDYRLREGLDILRAAGVACNQFDHTTERVGSSVTP